jgi:DNA uptake protein ComE-like DNA-binding protein
LKQDFHENLKPADADRCGHSRKGCIAGEPGEDDNRCVHLQPAKCAAWLASAVLALAFANSPARSQVAKTAPQAERAPVPEDRLDINRASFDELMRVPGMTRSWAGRILRFRPYRTKQDLLDHGIVPPVVYARIKDYLIAHREKQ